MIKKRVLILMVVGIFVFGGWAVKLLVADCAKPCIQVNVTFAVSKTIKDDRTGTTVTATADGNSYNGVHQSGNVYKICGLAASTEYEVTARITTGSNGNYSKSVDVTTYNATTTRCKIQNISLKANNRE